jgi:ubiquitin carboxyl-terminal hydrolase 25/28
VNPTPTAEDTAAVSNPISMLFYGKMQVEGKMNGAEFSRVEPFGQYPLQVNNFSDLHESLENSTAHEKIRRGEADESDDDSGQELWFTELPPLLIFSLSRFQFNTERRHAEKIHNRLDFPEVLYMDRYVADNRVVTRRKREEVRRLKANKEELDSRLQRFTEYTGNNSAEAEKKLSLQLVLQYAMDFTTSSASVADINMASPPDAGSKFASAPAAVAASNLMQVDSPCGSPKMTPASSVSNLANTKDGDPGAAMAEDPMDVEMDSVAELPAPAAVAEEASKSSAVSCDNAAAAAASAKASKGIGGPMVPCPRHVSEVELQVIKVRD